MGTYRKYCYAYSCNFISPYLLSNARDRDKKKGQNEEQGMVYKIVNVLPKVHSPDERWRKAYKILINHTLAHVIHIFHW